MKTREKERPHLVPLIVRVDGDGRVAEQRLRSSGGDDDLLVGAFKRVGERGDDTELELFLRVVARNRQLRPAVQDLLVDLRSAPEKRDRVRKRLTNRSQDAAGKTDLEVTEGGVHGNTPVDKTVRAVDDTIVVEADEGLGNRLGQGRVHRERDAVPVA